MKRAFETIQSKGSKALILDLRGNGGGEDQLGKFLFSYLIDAPFILWPAWTRISSWPWSYPERADEGVRTIAQGAGVCGRVPDQRLAHFLQKKSSHSFRYPEKRAVTRHYFGT